MDVLGSEVRSATGTRTAQACTPEEQSFVDIGLEFDAALAPRGIAVAGAGELRPRPVELLDPSGAIYQDAARTMAREIGATTAEPTVEQVIRNDLDGNGTAEVLVTGYRVNEPLALMAEAGDWSGVLLRAVVGDDFQTTIVDSSVVAPEAVPYILVDVVGAVADLNGDGRMEVVLSQRYFEGRSTVVYEYGADGTLHEVLSAGCGV